VILHDSLTHDSLTGDILYRLLAGVGKHESDAELERLAGAAVDLIFGKAMCPEASQRRFGSQ
jgi:hypothetical protein